MATAILAALGQYGTLRTTFTPLSNAEVALAFLQHRTAANQRLSTNGEILVANGSRVLAMRDGGSIVVAGGSTVVSDEHLDVCREIAAAQRRYKMHNVDYQPVDSLSLAADE